MPALKSVLSADFSMYYVLLRRAAAANFRQVKIIAPDTMIHTACAKDTHTARAHMHTCRNHKHAHIGLALNDVHFFPTVRCFVGFALSQRRFPITII